jgi:transposase
MGNKVIKNKNILNGKTLLVTVDIGKKINYGYCRFPDGSEIEPFDFYNSGVGFRKFWHEIERLRIDSGLEAMVVGIESTGCYGEPLLHFLNKRKGVELVQVNPMHTKRLKELQGNSPQKSDRKDPKVIADIICLGHALSVVIPEGVIAILRQLSHARERDLSRRSEAYNQLQDLIFRIFPEFGRVMKDVSSKSSHHLLRHYPLPAQIVEMGLNALRQLLHQVSRGRLGEDRAIKLYRAARNSGGIPKDQEGTLIELEHLLDLIELCNSTIATLEEKISKLLKEVPCSPYILSIKGIGEITAAGLIGEVGDFNQFKSIGELLKFSGLELYEVSSGKHKGNRHITKRGRPLIRKLLYFAAINTIRKGGAMHEHYQRHRQKGMTKPKAMVAIMRKLLGIIFALVRNHCEYIPGYEPNKKNKLAA